MVTNASSKPRDDEPFTEKDQAAPTEARGIRRRADGLHSNEVMRELE
jgi:hypothetical protein